MAIRFATDTEITRWDALVLRNPDHGNVFQGYEFAQQKQQFGKWHPRFIRVDTLSITVLEKAIPGLGRFWYMPKGPGITTTKQLDSLFTELRPFAKKHGVFAVKIEPELIKTTETMETLHRLGLRTVTPVQPNFSTVLVDISPPTGDILASLNQKGRHAIKRAERDGVQVAPVEASEANCALFYQLLTATATGNFAIRPYPYYRAFWQRYAANSTGQLFFAYVDNQVVAAAFAMVYGTKSTYKDGASVRERTVYGASHLLQWHVMQWAKTRGARSHDLCGAPPSTDITNQHHKFYGMGRFKSFNKQVTDYIGAFDLIISPQRYAIWAKAGERLALRRHWQKYHENWY